MPTVDWDEITYDNETNSVSEGSSDSSSSDSDEEGVGDTAEKNALTNNSTYKLFHYLVPFTNLSSLSIGEMDDNLAAWRRDIVEILGSNPGLQELSLSICEKALTRLSYQARQDDFLNFFVHLCYKYRHYDYPPLRLRKLHLGYSVLLWAETNEQGGYKPTNRAEYLSGLTDLSYLEEVHVENRCQPDVESMYLDPAASGLAWGDFAPPHAPRLRRFSAHEYTEELAGFLGSSFTRAQAERLALSFEIPCSPRNPGPALDEIQRPDARHPNQPLHFRIAEIVLREDSDVPLPSSSLDRLVDRCATLEGGTIHTLGGIWTAADFRDEVDLLKTALRHPRVAGLRQLWVRHVQDLSPYADENPKALQAIRAYLQKNKEPPGYKPPRDNAWRDALAWELAEAGRGLRYVKIESLALQVFRGEEGKAVDLKALDRREQREIECFREAKAIEFP